MKLNPKDAALLNKHDYDNASVERWAANRITDNSTFSVGIFQWVLKGSGGTVKASKIVVRVKGLCSNRVAVLQRAKEVIEQLDNGTYFGKSTIIVK